MSKARNGTARDWERQAQALADVAAKLSSSLDLEQVLATVLEQVARVIPSDAANIMLIDGDHARMVQWRGYDLFDSQASVSKQRFLIEKLPSLRQMRDSGQPLVVADVTADPGWVPVNAQEWLRSYAAAPISARERSIGFLNLDSATPHFFDESQAASLRAFADLAANAIENARMYETAQLEIAERAKAEKALRASEEKFKSLFEGTADAIFVADPATRQLVDCNQKALSLIGRSQHEVLSMKADRLHPADRVEDTMEAFARHSRGEILFVESEVLTKDGRRIPVNINTSVVEIGGKPRLVGMFRDDTERARAEETYHTLVEKSLQGLVILQGQSIEFANPAAAETLGYSTEELLSLPPEKVEGIIHLDDRSTVWERYRDRLEGKDIPPRYEFRMVRKDGKSIWVEMIATVIEFGGRPAVQAALMDITERVHHEQEQKAMVTVGAALRAAQTRDEMLPMVLDLVIELLEAKGVALVLRDTNTDEVDLELGRGEWAGLTGLRLDVDDPVAGMSMVGGQSHVQNGPATDPRLASLGVSADTPSIAGIPLVVKDRTIGALWMGSAAQISREDLLLLTTIGEITTSAIHQATLFDDLERSNLELGQAYETTLEGWSRALELRCHETEGHTKRVAEMTGDLARSLGMNDREIAHIRRGALLHDIGKIAIPDAILMKPGPLTEEEWREMRTHPEHARRMLAPIAYLSEALSIPYCHHERWDGSGYPQGLADNEIPLPARLFAVVDVWDALLSDRPYREAWPEKRVIEYIREHSGTLFDPQIVAAFLT